MDRGQTVSRERGSAVVELAVLLPAYALVILATLYFGYGWLIQQEGFEASHYAAHAPGDQTSEVSEHFFRYYEGTPQQTEEEPAGDIFKANDPTSGNDPFDFHDILQELSYTFWGGFTVVGGDLVWETQGGLNGTGRYIETHDIMGDEQLAGMAWTMNGWVTRREARTKVTFGSDPFSTRGMNQAVGPAAGTVTEENRFRGPGVNDQGESIEMLIDTMLRGSRTRPLTSPRQGVGANIYELINRFNDAAELPGYPDFGQSDGFWDQETRPDLGN